jgi:Chaperone of endosialidase
MRMLKTLGLVALASGLWSVAPASAQPIGTYRWQLQPYCNVITVAVVQQGGQYQLHGTDDQCGATVQASVVGLAFQNNDGSIGFGLSIVTAPGATPVHVDATIAIATLSGTWRDSSGNSGTFIFTPGAGVPGSPRPVLPGGIAPLSITNVQIANNTIGAAQINTAEVQQRLTAGTGISIAGTTISFNGEIGASTELLRRGVTGTHWQANGWQPDPTGLTGVWLESGTLESGGFFANGETAAIWSPGDTDMTVRTGAVVSTQVLLAIFDEDFLGPGTTPQPEFIFSKAGRAIDTFTGAHLTVGGTWTNASDRNRKKNIVQFNPQDALERLRRLPIYQWNYIAEGDAVRHVGPMAQDFHAAFGLNGDDDTHIATVDADGVVMASVVAVADETDALRHENTRLLQQISDLEARLARIEKLLADREQK